MKAKDRKHTAPKLTDAERHARFVETARKVGASEDPKDFDSAMDKIIGKSKSGSSRSRE
jgi:hypothetical protein